MKELIFAIDFDGTMVEHQYPCVGKDVPGAVHVMHKIMEAGHHIILYTMRDNINKVPEWPEPNNCAEADTVLQQAINWCKDRGIELLDVNNNPRATFSKSRKVYANVYIDDAALGCPLVMHDYNYTLCRAMVDWYAVEQYLMRLDMISKKNPLPTSFYADNRLDKVKTW